MYVFINTKKATGGGQFHPPPPPPPPPLDFGWLLTLFWITFFLKISLNFIKSRLEDVKVFFINFSYFCEFFGSFDNYLLRKNLMTSHKTDDVSSFLTLTSFFNFLALLKKSLRHKCPVNFEKCLRILFSQNTSKRLLLKVIHSNYWKR